MNTLVVVDMQDGFSESSDKVVREVQIECIRAMKRGDRIVILEFDGYGPTHPDIIQAVENYGYVIVTKEEDDGSAEALSVLPPKKRHRILLCGVNTCACVYSTGQGFRTAGHTVVPLVHACACNSPSIKRCRKRLRQWATTGKWRSY